MDLSFLSSTTSKVVGFIVFMFSVFIVGMDFQKRISHSNSEKSKPQNIPIISNNLNKVDTTYTDMKSNSPVQVSDKDFSQQNEMKNLKDTNTYLNNQLVDYKNALVKWQEYEKQTNFKINEYVSLLNTKDKQIKELSSFRGELDQLKADSKLLNDKLENPIKYKGYGDWTATERRTLENRVSSIDAKISILYQKFQ
jgi:predicted  nucleic acid-binding Zn-ribbon protein